jgi:hypothetical protein
VDRLFFCSCRTLEKRDERRKLQRASPAKAPQTPVSAPRNNPARTSSDRRLKFAALVLYNRLASTLLLARIAANGDPFTRDVCVLPRRLPPRVEKILRLAPLFNVSARATRFFAATLQSARRRSERTRIFRSFLAAASERVAALPPKFPSAPFPPRFSVSFLKKADLSERGSPPNVGSRRRKVTQSPNQRKFKLSKTARLIQLNVDSPENPLRTRGRKNPEKKTKKTSNDCADVRVLP